MVTLKWIDETDFGYYALCPEAGVAAWDGTEALDACSAYVGRVGLAGHGDVLVLGGEPLPATYLDRQMTFVRWYAAVDDSGLEHAVDQAMGSDGWEDAIEISLGGSYRLMDCLNDGEGVTETDTIRIHIPQGRYLVQSLFIEPSSDEQFMLERLVGL
ncbi:Imm21 family immunity protein [Kitasatospora sp. NPDC057015]|uniref:Imm21 family immunity protein n=1 Tax=Kitasatospora sp. NPDC057015 TaxID=3346001 RepID=UPI003638B517